MKILFVCKHNRFRSKVAEALFNKYNKDKENEAKSAGVKLDIMHVAENVKKALEEKGIKEVDNLPREVSEKEIKWADKIIVVANDVSTENFPKEKTEVWFVSDINQGDLEGIRKRVDMIEYDVKALLKRVR